VAGLAPSPDSALVIAVALPPDLERLRLRHVPDAAAGLPAHVTLLHPFVAPSSIDGAVVSSIDRVVSGHRAWTMTQAAPGRWPDAVYATVEPDAPARALQAQLAATFPDLPLYGEPGLRFEPHVTLAEGEGAADPLVTLDAAWAELPVTRAIDEIALIVRSDGHWRMARAFPLAAAATVGR
jgi:2'-5' RNA ligase